MLLGVRLPLGCLGLPDVFFCRDAFSPGGVELRPERESGCFGLADRSSLVLGFSVEADQPLVE